MIISHKHKFIFVKTKKTASTSLEIALSSICGPRDIITPITPEDEQYKLEQGYRPKQNYYVPISKYSKGEMLRALSSFNRLKFFNHMDATTIRKYVDKDCWDTYYKFTFERNPYDKLISWYYWNGGDEKYTSLNDFIQSGMAAKLKGFDFYAENGEIIVDRVYKYEDMENAIVDISRKIGLSMDLKLPTLKAKGGYRKDKRHYRDILNDDQVRWVRKVFAREIAYFDYEF